MLEKPGGKRHSSALNLSSTPPLFLDRGDRQGRRRLTAVAIKFTDMYGNVWDRLFESEYLPRDCAARLYLLDSPDNRLAEFCQSKSIIPE